MCGLLWVFINRSIFSIISLVSQSYGCLSSACPHFDVVQQVVFIAIRFQNLVQNMDSHFIEWASVFSSQHVIFKYLRNFVLIFVCIVCHQFCLWSCWYIGFRISNMLFQCRGVLGKIWTTLGSTLTLGWSWAWFYESVAS